MSQRRCGLSEAWRITAAANPTASILMSAFGRSRQTVQFFNSRQATKLTPEKAEAKKTFATFVNEKQKIGLNYGTAYNAAAQFSTAGAQTNSAFGTPSTDRPARILAGAIRFEF